jgi:hypothetical protein
VLTDRRLIKQLIDKKSSICSNRPTSYVGIGLVTGGDHLLNIDYGNTWRQLAAIASLLSRLQQHMALFQSHPTREFFLLIPHRQSLSVPSPSPEAILS